jgi:hypothetical protein
MQGPIYQQPTRLRITLLYAGCNGDHVRDDPQLIVRLTRPVAQMDAERRHTRRLLLAHGCQLGRTS